MAVYLKAQHQLFLHQQLQLTQVAEAVAVDGVVEETVMVLTHH